MSAPARARLEELGLPANCVDVLRHLWDYLDDQITPEGAGRLRAHIASCEQCRGMEAYQECFFSAVAKLRASLDAPVAVRERLAEQLKGMGCGCWEKAKGK